MKRREFLQGTSLGAIGLGWLGASNGLAPLGNQAVTKEPRSVAKNIIFMVSDGMSIGTLQMADLFSQMQLGRRSHWLQLYDDRSVRRALMETASLNSYVTDSAAASSSWGGGRRVRNGRLNVGPNNVAYKPILQKFKHAGKSVGCVTSVPITHATPAGFCVNSRSRSDQSEIASKYLPLRFDVMLGGGKEYFTKDKREDKVDMFTQFEQVGYHVAKTRNGLLSRTPDDPNPVLGVFHSSAIPFSIDHQNTPDLQTKVPTLAEMAQFAINRLKGSDQGFVLQIEGGKVDWAAHANDTPALLHDQLAFDEAIQVAVEFAEADQNTLVIITTDHGNANPGILGTSNSKTNFERTLKFRHSHEWIMKGLDRTTTVPQFRERAEYALGFAISEEDADQIVGFIASHKQEDGTYNPYKMPFGLFAKLMQKYTSVSWAGDDHSADHVELAMLGPGSEMLPSFVKNTDLHNFMLRATGVVNELLV